MTPAELDGLKERAGAATPGPWIYHGLMYGGISSLHPGAIAHQIEQHGTDHVRAYGGALVGESVQKSDGDYLASVSPEATIALIGVARAAQELLNALGGRLSEDPMFDDLRAALEKKLGA